MDTQDERIVGKTKDVGWQIGVRRTFFTAALDALEAKCENPLH
jgi:hypothetical protein